MKNAAAGKDGFNEIDWTYLTAVVDTLREPFLILDEKLVVLSVNRVFCTLFHINREETEGKHIYDIGGGLLNIPKLKKVLGGTFSTSTFIEGVTLEHDFPKIGRKFLTLNAHTIYTAYDGDKITFLALEDGTMQKQLESQFAEYAKKVSLEVSQRTKELEDRVYELERVNKVMVGRELKMIELKKEVDSFRKVIEKGRLHAKGKKANE